MTFGFDLISVIKSAGYFGIFAAILLENGVPLLFFLPGDTLLLTAGFLAAQGFLNIEVLVLGGFFMAIFGYMLGYYLGQTIGLKLFSENNSRYLKMEHLEKTREFYNKYGNLSLLLARFLPLRACVCFMAGVAQMRYGTFMFYNIVGAFAWGVILPLIGFYLGKMIPINDLKTLTLIPLVAVIATISLAVFGAHYLKKKSKTEDKDES
jgi:membrane-associated protein